MEGGASGKDELVQNEEMQFTPTIFHPEYGALAVVVLWIVRDLRRRLTSYFQ